MALRDAGIGVKVSFGEALALSVAWGWDVKDADELNDGVGDTVVRLDGVSAGVKLTHVLTLGREAVASGVKVAEEESLEDVSADTLKTIETDRC